MFAALFHVAGLFEVETGVSSWYPPSGWRFAVLLLFGWRVAFGLLAAELAFALLEHPDPRWAWLGDPDADVGAALTALVTAAIPPTCYAMAAAALTRRWPWWSDNRITSRLLAFLGVAFAASLATAVLACVNNAAAGFFPWSHLASAIAAHWRGDLIGVLTLTPALMIGVGLGVPRLWPGFPVRVRVARLLADIASDVPDRPPALGGEIAVVCGLTILLSVFAPAGAVSGSLVVLPGVWLALRFGVVGAALASLAGSLAVAALTAGAVAPEAAAVAQFMMILISMTTLLLGGVVSELAKERKGLDQRIDDQTRELRVEIERRRGAEQSARREQERAQTYLSAARTAIVALDLEGRVSLANDETCTLLGRHWEDLHALDWLADVVPEDERGPIELLLQAANDSDGSSGRPWIGTVRTASGEKRRVDWRPSILRDESGVVTGLLLAGIDVTEREAAEHRVRFLATHDAVTGLRNRNSLLDHFPEAIARTRRNGTRLIALYIDLDGFKRINDDHGHGIGDRLLAEIARRIRGCVRETDMVARLGGDEFLVLLEDVTDPAAGRLLAGKVLDVLRPPADFGAIAITVRASIGIAALPDHAATADELLAAADAAMYAAKRRRVGGVSEAGSAAAARGRRRVDVADA